MIKEKKILFTGLSQNRNNFEALTNLGVDVFFFPTIKIVEEKLSKTDFSKLNSAADYNYIIFTSANALIYFWKKTENKLKEINDSKTQIIVIGTKTKEKAESFGFQNLSLPENSSSEELEKYLSTEKIENKKILIPVSKIANHKLRDSLVKKGASVDFVPIYNTIRNDDIENSVVEKVKKTLFDLIIFTSPSSFNNFVKILNIENVKEYFEKTIIAAIGPVTKKAMEKFGLNVAIQPGNFNVKSLVKEITKIF